MSTGTSKVYKIKIPSWYPKKHQINKIVFKGEKQSPC